MFIILEFGQRNIKFKNSNKMRYLSLSGGGGAGCWNTLITARATVSSHALSSDDPLGNCLNISCRSNHDMRSVHCSRFYINITLLYSCHASPTPVSITIRYQASSRIAINVLENMIVIIGLRKNRCRMMAGFAIMSRRSFIIQAWVRNYSARKA